jgi:hypothetical protein
MNCIKIKAKLKCVVFDTLQPLLLKPQELFFFLSIFTKEHLVMNSQILSLFLPFAPLAFVLKGLQLRLRLQLHMACSLQV